MALTERQQADIERGFLPGHTFRVIRGPYVGQIGIWACTWAEKVIGLTWPGLGSSFMGGPEKLAFRLEDLEDITDELV